jgi:pilus assembly protein TadC
LAPATTELGDALSRLSPDRRPAATVSSDVDASAVEDRLGLWAMRRIPSSAWGHTPYRELAMLEIPVHRYYGRKIFYALVGLVLPPLLVGFFALLNLHLPFVIPVLGSLALAAFMFFMPDLNVREEAGKARAEFARALVAYIDLVALERQSGAGTRQAMESAATVGDSRPFQRIGEELARSRWSGQAPWDALRALAEELSLPELNDFADIMRLSGEHGTQVYSSLRARVAALRDASLKKDLAQANAVGEKMSIPMSLLGVIFMAILVAPSLLRVFQGG